jgi:STE24 endopeptidase
MLLISGVELVWSLPWSIISTFVIEEKHGFNKQTPLLFFSELVALQPCPGSRAADFLRSQW